MINNANNSMIANMDEEYDSILILRRWVSAVRPRSMQVLHIHTSIINTIEQIVIGKYRVGTVISMHMLGCPAVMFGYVLAGQVV